MTSRHEPVIVQTNRFGAPGRFYWQGRAYTIDGIDRIWRRPHGIERGRRVYKVRSRGKTFLLQFDQRLQRWSIMRAPWRTRLGLAVARLAARITS
ncbi:MAG TPA: hypothetical protein EYP25_04470 [Anaerolineae bacterium]|nr:hypothetical protein [Anaerolineae bacterium]HIQ11907.1 hypothetical protein [Caldilineales bacterium]